MTACKDSLSGKKAVSATLAGVLAVGMVPAAAFAADADQPETGDIELQAKTPKQAFETGEFSFTDQAGNAVTTTAKKDGSTANKAIVLGAADDNQYLVPSSVKIDGVADAIDLTDTDKYVVTYATEDGTAIPNPLTIKNAGVYQVTVTAKAGDYYNTNSAENATKTFFFKIKEATLEGVTLYEYDAAKGAADQDFSDSTFDFTGNAIAVKATKDDADLAAAITYYNAADKTLVDAADLKHAGDYIANVKVGNQDVDIPFTINAVDLSKATVVMSDVKNGVTPTVQKAGSLSADMLNKLQVIPEATQDFTKVGTHKATVQLADASGANKEFKNDILNSATVEYSILTDTLKDADFKYDNATFPTATAKYILNGTKDDYAKGSFDCDKIAVYKFNTTDYTSDNKLAAGTDYTVTVTDTKTGEVVDAAKTQTAGNWTVTVKALYTDEDGNVYGATKSVDVEVIAGVFASADVTFTHKGKVASSVNTAYTGEDIAKDIAITVTSGTGTKKDIAITVTSGTGTKKVTLVEGTDYKVTIKNGTKEVDSIVDKGTYTVKVDGLSYRGSDTINVTVSAAQVNNVRAKGLSEYTDANGNTKKFVAYTGSAIDLALQYETTGETNKDKQKWSDLPTDAYTISKIEYKAKASDSYKDAKEIKDAGLYKVTLAHNNKDVKGNFEVSATYEFEVNEGKYFGDVLPGDWFYGEVNKAKNLGYVRGVGDTGFFAPYDSMTRADVCVVLYRMAGGKLDADEGNTNVNRYYETGFNDTDDYAYYAKAVQWAAKSGIVTGYGDTGSFGPNDNVTREQFATMLYRYAGSPVAEGSLADYSDESQVDSWAKEAVLWSVSAGVMGKDTTVLAPAKDVLRAEVAAMAVRYQPNGPTTL